MNQNPYTLTKHSILPLIYRIIQIYNNKITYLMRQPQSKSLILFGQNLQSLNQFMSNQQHKKYLKEIQSHTQSKIKYVFLNHKNLQNNDQNRNTKILKYQKSQRNQQLITPDIQGDLKPLVVGDLAICYIDCKGYRNPYSMIAVTHLTQNSTKIPILFTGSMISPCSINYHDDSIKPMNYLQALQKLRYFPSQTYLFPTLTVFEEDLVFAKALINSMDNNNDGPGSQFLEQKMKIFSKNKQHKDALIPTTVLQERMMNPFLLSDKFKGILGTNDKQKSFTLLRKMRQQFIL